MYCVIHFTRGVDRVTGTQNASNVDSLNAHMRQLLHCSSQDDYYELLDTLQGMYY